MFLIHNPKAGFTIMDLLISTAIVSLLSSIFLFQVTEAKKKAEDGQMKVVAQQVSNAVSLYRNDNGGKPPLVTSTGSAGTPGYFHQEWDPSSDYIPTMQLLVDQGYLSKIPKSTTGASFVYGVTQDGDSVIFGVKMNKTSSGGSNKNRCQVSIPITEYYEGPDCFWIPPKEECFTDEEGLTLCTYEPGQWACMPEPNPPSITPPKCDGSSEYDYCQCI